MATLAMANLIYAQNNNEALLYGQFDNAVGKGNLGINNGSIHLNNLHSANKTHRYYGNGQYIIGTLVYDGQPYSAISLKYDLLKDIIVAKTPDPKSNININLITEKTAMFVLDGKKFVNLNYNTKTPDFIGGFYEEERLAKPLCFYTKYRKMAIEELRTSGIFYSYEEVNSYAFSYRNNLYRIASKGDALAVFPQLEKEIDAFFDRNTALERSDKKLFFITLLKHISNSLPNDAN